MKKEKRIVVLVQNRHREDNYEVMKDLPIVTSEEAALEQFRREKDRYPRGDNYGAIPYWTDVIVDVDEYYIPVGIAFASELTMEHEAW